MKTDVTAVLTGHKEGHLCVPTLRSFQRCVEQARSNGLRVQTLYVLDRPNEQTQALFKKHADPDGQTLIVDVGDQGKARNMAVAQAAGHYCAFLDADDFWTFDWIARAYSFLKDAPETWIAHPQFNYFFEMQASVYEHIDQEAENFDWDILRLTNYWDALCLCPTQVYRDIPFYSRDIANGWAYEDWYWNCETSAAGLIHKVVPDTVLFKRRQKSSQTIKASENKSMIKPTVLSRYDHAVYGSEEPRIKKS